MKASREARAEYAKKAVREIEEAMKDPRNFTKNKVAEEAAKQIKIGGDEDGSSEPS